MPYITDDRRRELTKQANADTPQNAGELNFVLTMVVCDYVRTHGLFYQTLNDVSGALTECLGEFRHRVISPYEVVARVRNGDVYEWFVELLKARTA